MGDKKTDIVAGNDLPDFNPDEEYLQELKSPIYYAVQKDIDIRTGGPTLIDFDMQRISQLDLRQSLFFSHYDPQTVKWLCNYGKSK